MRGAPQRGLARLIFRIRFRTSGDTRGRPSRWRLFQFQYRRNPLRCQAMTVSGLTRSSAERQSFHNRESQTHGTRSAQRRRSLAHGSNVARPEADAGVQESLLAEQRELGNNLAEKRVRSAWSGKATGRDSVNANNFNENGLFGRDSRSRSSAIRIRKDTTQPTGHALSELGHVVPRQ
jgi:hypothetical protein